jgi:peptidyl-prolyl cis-trans isomerase C
MYQQIVTVVLSLLFMMSSAFSQSSEKPPLSPPAIIATVNGVKIFSDLYEVALNNYIQQGIKDSSQLREQIKNELIAKEVLTQESTKLGLDKNIALQNQLTLMHESFWADVVVSKYLEKSPVTDDILRTEYKRQVDALAGTEQYLLSQIVLTNESDAKAALKALQNGENFDKVAKERSIDPSKSNAGSLGWVIPNQIIPAISNVMVNLKKGSFSVAPIQTSMGWHIIKVDDKRPFKAPIFEDSKQQLTQAVLLQIKSDYIQKLVKSAKVDIR